LTSLASIPRVVAASTKRPLGNNRSIVYAITPKFRLTFNVYGDRFGMKAQ
jgi:hypothetical protein